jgi:hypothetical protein
MAIVRIANDDVTFGYSQSPSVLMLTGAGLSAVTSGDVIRGDDVAFGTDLAGVALADYRDSVTPVPVLIDGVVKLAVTAKSGAGVNGAVHVGDYVYVNSGDSRVDLGPGTLALGRALEPVTSGEEATINVQVRPQLQLDVGDDTTYMTLAIPVADLSAITADTVYVMNGWTPGFAGSVLSLAFVTGTTPASTAGKDIDLQVLIDATPTTGGLLTLLTADINAIGKVKDATAITAANTFAADDTLSIKCQEATAAFSEGNGTLLLTLACEHDHT